MNIINTKDRIFTSSSSDSLPSHADMLNPQLIKTVHYYYRNINGSKLTISIKRQSAKLSMRHRKFIGCIYEMTVDKDKTKPYDVVIYILRLTPFESDCFGVNNGE